MAWNKESRHWIVERQSGSGSFVIWPIDPLRSLESQGIHNEVVGRDFTWAEARTWSDRWNAVRDFLGPNKSNQLDGAKLNMAYGELVRLQYIQPVAETVDS